MPVDIFHVESAPEERILTVLDDGTVYYHISPNYPPFKPIGEKMTAEAAKVRWPSYAAEIDAAVASLSQSN